VPEDFNNILQQIATGNQVLQGLQQTQKAQKKLNEEQKAITNQQVTNSETDDAFKFAERFKKQLPQLAFDTQGNIKPLFSPEEDDLFTSTQKAAILGVPRADMLLKDLSDSRSQRTGLVMQGFQQALNEEQAQKRYDYQLMREDKRYAARFAEDEKKASQKALDNEIAGIRLAQYRGVFDPDVAEKLLSSIRETHKNTGEVPDMFTAGGALGLLDKFHQPTEDKYYQEVVNDANKAIELGQISDDKAFKAAEYAKNNAVSWQAALSALGYKLNPKPVRKSGGGKGKPSRGTGY